MWILLPLKIAGCISAGWQDIPLLADDLCPLSSFPIFNLYSLHICLPGNSGVSVPLGYLSPHSPTDTKMRNSLSRRVSESHITSNIVGLLINAASPSRPNANPPLSLGLVWKLINTVPSESLLVSCIFSRRSSLSLC